jgi:hypothetical protein
VRSGAGNGRVYGEVVAAACLSRPNTVTLLDVGRAEQGPYYAERERRVVPGPAAFCGRATLVR